MNGLFETIVAGASDKPPTTIHVSRVRTVLCIADTYKETTNNAIHIHPVYTDSEVVLPGPGCMRPGYAIN